MDGVTGPKVHTGWAWLSPAGLSGEASGRYIGLPVLFEKTAAVAGDLRLRPRPGNDGEGERAADPDLPADRQASYPGSMNDSQIVSVAIMALAILVGAIFNNSRIGDVSRRIDDMRDLLGAEMAKNHSEMLHRFAELDGRFTRIETHLELK